MRVAYVCEGGPGIGWGHVQRGCTLAEARDGQVTLMVGRGEAEVAGFVALAGIPATVASWRAEHEFALEELAEFEVVVADHYRIDATLLAELNRTVPVVVVDDWMRERVSATGLLNSNIGAAPADYSDSTVRFWATGAHYALVRRAIRQARPAPPSDGAARRVLVTFGGSDPEARTATVVERVVRTTWFASGGTLVVVLGRSYTGPEPWNAWPQGVQQRVEVHRDPDDFAELCVGADLVIAAGGTTVYELCCLGRPFLPVAAADNQARIVREFARLGLGSGPAVWEPYWLETLAADVEVWTRDGAQRREAAERVKSVVDGRGADRVWAFLDQVAGRDDEL